MDKVIFTPRNYNKSYFEKIFLEQMKESGWKPLKIEGAVIDELKDDKILWTYDEVDNG